MTIRIVSLQKDEWFIWSHICFKSVDYFLMQFFSKKGCFTNGVDVSSICWLAALTPVVLHWPPSPMWSRERRPWRAHPHPGGVRADFLKGGHVWTGPYPQERPPLNPSGAAFGGRRMVVDAQMIVEVDLDSYCVSS